jgi:hypothetical protein
MTENQTIFYDAWINDLLRSVEALREDKQDLLVKVARLEEMVAEYGTKINNLLHNRGDE